GPDYPGERLIVCKNPFMAEERARKRSELLAATEKDLARIQARVQRPNKPLRGAAAIGQAVGAVLGKRKMAKHYVISITDEAFSFTQNQAAIAAEVDMSSAPMCRNGSARRRTRCAPTKASPRSSR